MSLTFDTDGTFISWTSGNYGFVDKNGKSANRTDIPSVHNLLVHYLSKCIEGVNGKGELAIIQHLKYERT